MPRDAPTTQGAPPKKVGFAIGTPKTSEGTTTTKSSTTQSSTMSSGQTVDESVSSDQGTTIGKTSMTTSAGSAGAPRTSSAGPGGTAASLHPSATTSLATGGPANVNYNSYSSVTPLGTPIVAPAMKSTDYLSSGTNIPSSTGRSSITMGISETCSTTELTNVKLITDYGDSTYYNSESGRPILRWWADPRFKHNVQIQPPAGLPPEPLPPAPAKGSAIEHTKEVAPVAKEPPKRPTTNRKRCLRICVALLIVACIILAIMVGVLVWRFAGKPKTCTKAESDLCVKGDATCSISEEKPVCNCIDKSKSFVGSKCVYK